MIGSRIGIVTDSSSDLPPELAGQHEIEVVPLTIHFGKRHYVDGQDLSTKAFWEKFQKTRETPTITPPSVASFKEAYQRCGSRRAEEIVVLCSSNEEWGGSYPAAVKAVEEVDLPVRVVDCATTSIVLGMMAIAAAEAAHLGAGTDDVIAAAHRNRPELLGTVDAVEILRKNRRIGPVQAFLGRIVNTRFLVTINRGTVEVLASSPTRSRSLTTLLEWLGDRSDARRMALVHGDGVDVAGVIARAQDHVPKFAPIVILAGPVLGIQTGPGFVGFAASRG
ncbi:MAG: DegV family protein [Acidimicrobiia bacterium]